MRRDDAARPVLETLESRQLLSTFTVTNAGDSGGGSLRQAISDANNAPGADVIEFDASLTSATIGLTSGEITISGELTVNGLGQDNLEISGQRLSRVFFIANSASVSINNLTVKWGQQDNGLGGQVYVDQDASLTLTSVTLHDSQGLWGGGIYNNYASVSLIGSTVSEAKSFRHGGAIYSAGGPITVVNSSFVNNFASLDGGAIYTLNTARISGSTFSGNIARDNGGAIMNGADLTLTNSTLSGNQADDAGGGIYNWASISLHVYNSTIVGNTSPSIGGIANVSASATLYSTIVASNSGGDVSGTIDGTNNLIGGDPLLGPLADNGGPTLTRAVLPGSGAIRQGSNPLGLSTDQRGGTYARSFNGSVDIGAFQRQPVVQVVDTISDIDNGNFGPGDLSLREAIGRSNNDPEIFPTITFDPSLNDQTITLTGGELSITQSVDIQGPGRNLLRIFANHGSRVLYIEGSEVSISGLAFDAGSGGEGGAIYSAAAQLTLTDVGILNSRSGGQGGGLFVAIGDVTITDSVINANSSSDSGGGGIYARTGSLTINNSQITANTALFAGGIGSEGTLTIDGSTIDGNSAEGNGGGIENWNGQTGLAVMTITNSTITNNTSGDNGGGVRSFNGHLTITHSTIAGNTAAEKGGGVHAEKPGVEVYITTSRIRSNHARGGGGIYVADGVFELSRSEVSGNTSTEDGGGIRLYSVAVGLIDNSTISGNSALNWGGGIATYTLPDRGYFILNSTIVRNISDSDESGHGVHELGGGVHFDGGSISIHSTIIDENRTGPIPNDISGTLLNTSSRNNLVGHAFSSGGLSESNANLIGVSAQVGDLADNGGFTSTHALPEGSPAIDAGFNFRGSTLDQRGSPRTAGGEVDIGAYEVEANVRPTLTSLVGSQGNVVVQGETFRLTAIGAADSDGTIKEVRFYLDANGDGVGQGGERLGTDADSSGGYTLQFTAGQTAGFDLGTASFLAQAVDNDGEKSEGRGLVTTVIYSLESPSGGTVHATSIGSNTHLQVTRNRAGDLIVFTGSGAEWWSVRLNDVTSAPDVTGDPIIWTDPNDGLAYVAAPSANGFLLFRRATNGNWSYRDLASQTGNAADAPVGTLSYFVTRPKTGSPLVVVSGINDAGEIVAYLQTGTSQQTSQASWTLYNISDDLASQSMTTPAFTQMTSYVTSWNQWTLAGLDGSGNVQGVWVNIATFTTWRVDNLSAITGANTLVGELDVTLTSWGGIRFAGANASGRLVATWWNPALGSGNWKQTDLTAAVPGFEAPALNGGQLTAWFTSADRISYAGYDQNGDVVSFYWQPGDGGSWSSDNLTASLPNRDSRPVGTVTSHVSASGETSLVGVSSDGHVVRLWRESASDAFSLDNLSDLAVRG